MSALTLAQSNQLLVAGSVIAYPTEAVFGLGCDPDNQHAVLTLLTLKQRPIEKGLILIARNFDQLIPYIDDKSLTEQQIQLITTPSSKAITWVVPKNNHTPYWLTGQFDSIAIRICAHPLVKELCLLFGKPLVSTSANLSGQAPCRTFNEVETQFGANFPVLKGETAHQFNPSEIRDLISGKIIRQG